MAVQQRSYSRSVGVSRPSAQHIHAHALRGTSGVLQQLQSRPGRARACQGLQHATAAPRQQSRVQLQQQQKQQPAWVCRSSLASQATPEPIPDDVRLELNPDEASKEVLYDEASKTVRIPLAALNDGQRRTKMVMFTCNKCGGRSARLVNPTAWARGAVFCQCQHCGVWHMLKADKSIVEEIRYNDPDWKMPVAQQGQAGAAAAAAEAAEAAAFAGSGGVVELAPDDSQQSSGTQALPAAGDRGGDEEFSSKAQ